MIAVDTNILVYAHREDATWHDAALARVMDLAEGSTPWAIPWPCVHEFIAIATHPRIWSPPTPVDAALGQVAAWLESPSLVVLAETPGYWDRLSDVVRHARVAGPQIHDARVAALCLHHGVKELWTADRDFGRFPRSRRVIRCFRRRARTPKTPLSLDLSLCPHQGAATGIATDAIATHGSASVHNGLENSSQSVRQIRPSVYGVRDGSWRHPAASCVPPKRGAR